jgi:hypothetical protein
MNKVLDMPFKALKIIISKKIYLAPISKNFFKVEKLKIF